MLRAQTPASQQPNYQPGWPCTGKERAFDPVYSRVAEATGGHLFLFDKSETSGISVIAAGDTKHPVTITRASGKTDSYVDMPFWVDASVESLYVVASLQCMQTIFLYDPQRSAVDAKTAGVQDNWFRAGRISTVPHPQPGAWILRLLGNGAYSFAVQASSRVRLGELATNDGMMSTSLPETALEPMFQTVTSSGVPMETLMLAPDPNTPTLYTGSFVRPHENFRVQVEWRNSAGDVIERTFPLLYEPDPTPRLVK